MARELDSSNISESLSSAFSFIFFVAMDWPDGYVRIHSGIGTYTFGGNDYLGVGDLGGVDAVEETVEVKPRDLILTLSGVNSDIVADVMEDSYWNRDVDIYLGFVDQHGALVADPDVIWSGIMDNGEVVAGEMDSVRITCQSRARRMTIPNSRRFTSEDLQEEYSGDVFFEFLDQMQDVTLVWGGERVRATDVNNGISYAQQRGSGGRSGRGPGGTRNPQR